MVRVYFEYHNPVCDCCGHTLGAERDDEAAEAAMKADGWHKVEGKDLCRLCWQHYEETGRMPRKLIFYKEETNMEEVSNKKDLEQIEAAEGCADACTVEGVAESITTAEYVPTLSDDIIHAIAAEVKRSGEEELASAYETYAMLMKAIEDKEAIEKSIKEAMKQLWSGTKQNDGDVCAAYLAEIERVARDSAMAWVRIAATAKRGVESL